MINKILGRKGKVRFTTPGKYIKGRIAYEAAALFQISMDAAHVEVVNEAVFAMTRILYAQDADGVWANVDPRTHRILIPCPWGSKGWKKWGLCDWEARILRAVLLQRIATRRPGQRPALFDYNDLAHTWHINLSDYPSFEAASFWLRGSAISLEEWRVFADEYRRAGRERLAARKAR